MHRPKMGQDGDALHLPLFILSLPQLAVTDCTTITEFPTKRRASLTVAK